MSTIDRPETRTLPMLMDGERLDRATFHERYAAMPPETRAELIGGVVYMGSPVGYTHGHPDSIVTYWTVYYRRFTKGVGGAVNATTQFGDYGEVQPDCQLRLHEELGGQSQIVGGYVFGAPELVIEVSHTTRKKDLGPKKNDYERAGVQEYIFIGVDPAEVRWFIRRDGRFVEMTPGQDGIYRSEVFPGLWLDPNALLAEDLDGVTAALDAGIASPEHAAFVARLATPPRT